jgi:hypothetical protein
MHPKLLETVIAVCRQREAAGDGPKPPPFGTEILEGALLQLARDLEAANAVRSVLVDRHELADGKAADLELCSFCRHPANSATCQRLHA